MTSGIDFIFATQIVGEIAVEQSGIVQVIKREPVSLVLTGSRMFASSVV